MLNNASRARSLVGRTASPSGASRVRPRCLPAMIRMAGSNRAALRLRPVAAAELVSEDLARHLLDGAALEIAELKGTVGEADEAGDAVAEMLEHTADLAVTALAQPDLEPGVAALFL